jgi:hypothetical protein
MHSLPSPRSCYFAAFILGSLLALLIVTPGRSADTPPAAPFANADIPTSTTMF